MSDKRVASAADIERVVAACTAAETPQHSAKGMHNFSIAFLVGAYRADLSDGGNHFEGWLKAAADALKLPLEELRERVLADDAADRLTSHEPLRTQTMTGRWTSQPNHQQLPRFK